MASYLLIGCLGGLGRCFVDWMVKRGARNLIFLSRSSLTNKEAKKAVSELQRLKIKVTVVQGDVTSMTDVQDAVDAGFGLIKGVVQAPLALNVKNPRLSQIPPIVELIKYYLRMHSSTT